MASPYLQLGGSLAFAAAGFFLSGGSPTGAAIGFSIGSMVFAPDAPGATKADPGDLSFSTSSYGKFLPWGYGIFQVTPVTFWTTNWKAKKHEEGGGKGGGAPETEYYTYKRSFAMYLCDCTQGDPIIGIRAIENAVTGEVLYYVGDDADAATIQASKKFAAAVRVYTGTDTQDPDPLIEATEGWAPAWRGHAYLVIEDMKFGTSKQAIPLRVEVIRGGASVPPPTLVEAWAMNTNSWTLANGLLTNASYSSPSGGFITHTVTHYDLAGNQVGQEIYKIASSSLGHTYACKNDPHLAVYYLGASGDTGVTWWAVDGVKVAAPIRNWFSDADFYSVGSAGHFVRSGDYIFAAGTIGSEGEHFLSRYPGPVSWPDRGVLLTPFGVAAVDNAQGLAIGNDGYLYLRTYTPANTRHLFKFDQELNLLQSWDSNAFFASPTDNDDFVIYNDYFLRASGVSAEKVALYQFDATAFTFVGDLTVGTSGTVGNILLDGGPLVKTRGGIVSLEPLAQNTGQPLADVLTELAERSGKSTGDVDVSLVSGADLVFMGIGQAKGARDWMQELCGIYGYRMRNRAGVLQFLPKGGAVVATIPAADLGMDAGDYNTQSAINASRLQGTDLPRKVTVIHQDPSNGFIKGQQEYLMRNFAQGQDIELRPAVSLTAAQAREFAVTSAKEPHLERMTWETSLGIKWLKLEPGDPVTLPTGRAWIRDVREDGDHILRLTLQADSVAALTGNGLPAALPTVTPRKILLGGPTAFYPLDIPILTALSDDAGFYVAAHGWLPDWPGAQGYASSDGGESYSPAVLFDAAAAAGSATNTLTTQSSTQWDLVSALNVNVNSGTFSSNTEDQVYAGSGLCAYGADGRWELIQYQTATVEGNGTVTLSRLLRGQFGTEHNLANHAVGDKVVLLTAATVQRLPLTAAELNSARKYKAVTLGATLTDTAEVTFTDTGIGLKPLAPVLLRGGRKSSNDLDYSWKRRSRLPGIAFSDPPLGEESEIYAIDIYNAAFTAVVATRTATIPSDIFTAAQQTSAGLTPGNPVNMMIYQLSATVGRGYPLTGTI